MTQSAEQHERRRYRRFSIYCRVASGAAGVAAVAIAFIAPLPVTIVFSVVAAMYYVFLEWILWRERRDLQRRYAPIALVSEAERMLRHQRLGARFSLGPVILLAVAYTVSDLTARPFLQRYWIAAAISVVVAVLALVLLALVEAYYAKRIRLFRQ